MSKENIFIVPHYINSLNYYDKLYDYLLEENIETIYLFGENIEMVKYCVTRGRKYEILTIKITPNLKKLIKPIFYYFLMKKVKKLFKKYDPKLIIQVNDASQYNDIIVRAARQYKIRTLVLQWALTSPEEFYFKERKKKQILFYQKRTDFQNLIIGFGNEFLNKFHYLLEIALNVHSNHKQSFGQGVSDFIGVFNDYTKKILIKQGVDQKKIKLLGSLNYDDALNVKGKSINEIKKDLNINDADVNILFFSQPFYIKDINVLTLDEQLKYIEDLIKNIDDFYSNINKTYNLLIKLHPIEDIKNYKKFVSKKNITITKDLDNNDLIKLCDLCISQHSTILQNAIILKKPIISLNILNLIQIEKGSKIVGITQALKSWKNFIQILNILEKKNYTPFNYIDYDKVIADGKCYDRTISIIKILIKNSKKIPYPSKRNTF